MEKSNLDLTGWVVSFLKMKNFTNYKCQVPKDIFDLLRMDGIDRKSVVDIYGSEWEIVSFEMEYIGVGKDFFIDINLLCKETLREERHRKLNELL
jgi:hypothetical protein